MRGWSGLLPEMQAAPGRLGAIIKVKMERNINDKQMLSIDNKILSLLFIRARWKQS